MLILSFLFEKLVHLKTMEFTAPSEEIPIVIIQITSCKVLR